MPGSRIFGQWRTFSSPFIQLIPTVMADHDWHLSDGQVEPLRFYGKNRSQFLFRNAIDVIQEVIYTVSDHPDDSNNGDEY